MNCDVKIPSSGEIAIKRRKAIELEMNIKTTQDNGAYKTVYETAYDLDLAHSTISMILKGKLKREMKISTGFKAEKRKILIPDIEKLLMI
ncbi:hypothetical protein NPIL_497651 [Nephila pilipes]|uniref:Uncharacterized protein n=1 Tax=Nephila pilipes TaxID=299642 RepID=A0A8X6QAC5_NEPPI|nr:hypothetical protein NPIL_497651 [Nephila pilipes]